MTSYANKIITVTVKAMTFATGGPRYAYSNPLEKPQTTTVEPPVVIPKYYMMRGYDNGANRWCFWVTEIPEAEPAVTRPALVGTLSHVAIINSFE